MYYRFAELRRFFALKDINIDNWVFKLHYKVTVGLLLLFSIMVSLTQHFGDPIKCLVDDTSVSNFITTYCWIHSTFTETDKATGDAKFHRYYLWVFFFLSFQAVFFYVPYYIWKNFEGNKVSILSAGVNCAVIDKEDRQICKRIILKFFCDNHRRLNSYAFTFFLCEILNFVNVVAQIYLTDYFLGGEFTSYGFDVLKCMLQDPEQRVDPMAKVFPKTSKCTFHKYGSSGTLERLDALCILSINVVNEIFYVILWAWFFLLAVITGMFLIYRAAVLVCPCIRLSELRGLAGSDTKQVTDIVFKKCRIGDWFLLCQIGKNIDRLVFRELIMELANCFETKNQESLRSIKAE